MGKKSDKHPYFEKLDEFMQKWGVGFSNDKLEKFGDELEDLLVFISNERVQKTVSTYERVRARVTEERHRVGRLLKEARELLDKEIDKHKETKAALGVNISIALDAQRDAQRAVERADELYATSLMLEASNKVSSDMSDYWRRKYLNALIEQAHRERVRAEHDPVFRALLDVIRRKKTSLSKEDLEQLIKDKPKVTIFELAMVADEYNIEVNPKLVPKK